VVEAVEARAAAGLGLVDGAREVSANGIDLAVVEPAGRGAFGVGGQQALFAAYGVQPPQARPQARDETAAQRRCDAVEVLVHRIGPVGAGDGIVAMQPPAGEVDKGQRLLASQPDR
jgi:hypothetical protein